MGVGIKRQAKLPRERTAAKIKVNLTRQIGLTGLMSDWEIPRERKTALMEEKREAKSIAASLTGLCPSPSTGKKLHVGTSRDLRYH